MSKKQNKKAEALIQNSVTASCIIGAVPIPLLDVAALTAIQMNMAVKLAEIYKIDCPENVLESFATALPTTLGTTYIARGVAGSAVKFIPGIGSVIGAVTLPVIAGSTTYALGKVFKEQFANGNGVLDLEKATADMKDFYKDGLKSVKKLAKEIRVVGKDGVEAVKEGYEEASELLKTVIASATIHNELQKDMKKKKKKAKKKK